MTENRLDVHTEDGLSKVTDEGDDDLCILYSTPELVRICYLQEMRPYGT